MSPRMRTRSVSQPAVESLRGGTGVQVGKGRRGRRIMKGNDERIDDLNGQGNDQGLRINEGVEGINRNVEGANGEAPDFSTIIAKQLQNLLPAMLTQVGNQGNVGNQNGNVVNENIRENVGNVLVNGNRIRMISWEVDVSISWNDFQFMIIEEFCPSHEMQKLETELCNHAMVEASQAAYTDRFHELVRLVHHLVTLESKMIERYVYGLAPQICMMVAATELKTIQKAVQIFGALTDETVRNGSIKMVEKRGNVGEPSEDKSGMDNNKRNMTGNVFATTLNPVGRKNTGIEPNELGFRYEIEIASGQLVEIDKVVRIPLPDGKVLEVLGERPKEKPRLLMRAKDSAKKQGEIVM
nr:reverse transcriptase domain-containing protein [Tanacetum cinerariifolium]